MHAGRLRAGVAGVSERRPLRTSFLKVVHPYLFIANRVSPAGIAPGTGIHFRRASPQRTEVEMPALGQKRTFLIAREIVGAYGMAKVWPTARPPIVDIAGVAHERLEAFGLAQRSRRRIPKVVCEFDAYISALDLGF